jgi:hypothetical protein
MSPALSNADNAPGSLAKQADRILFVLFLLLFLIVQVRLIVRSPNLGFARWPEGLFLLITAAYSLLILARELPWQNVLAASGLIALLSCISERLAVRSQTFFSYPTTLDAAWAVPLFWVVAILNARSVARLTLFNRRNSPFYGLLLLGFAMLLATVFRIGLVSVCTTCFNASPASLWPMALYWMLTATLALVFASPWLLNKRPIETKPSFQPLTIWILLNLLLITASLFTRSWLITIMLVLTAVPILHLALTGRFLNKLDPL